ncbi:MAG: hypothetical protein RTU92_07115 [Candidatus Thorarchaeota archaeon]
MGRTVRTFRNAVDIDEARWQDFKRTLRPKQREHFGRIFDYARKCADAGTMLATPRITEVVMLSTLTELVGEIEELKRKISKLERTEATEP